MVLPGTRRPPMEPSPVEAETGRECVELLGRIRNEVGPLATAPADAAVIDVHGHRLVEYPPGDWLHAWAAPGAGYASAG